MQTAQTQTETEPKVIDAFCDCCPERESATAETLRREGWFIGEREMFCAKCDLG